MTSAPEIKHAPGSAAVALIGYGRVSTRDQSPAAQEAELREAEKVMHGVGECLRERRQAQYPPVGHQQQAPRRRRPTVKR